MIKTLTAFTSFTKPKALLAAGLTAACLFGNAISAEAQGPFTGKPRYQIQARRLGNVMGNIEVEMFPLIAPKHVRNWDSLVNQNFYDSTAFHRVIPGFVIQGGDPNSRHGPRSTWGYGQPNQPTVPAEFNAVSHQRGIFSAARSTNPNSATSQFFICVAPATSLDGNYSAYGKVTSGMNIVDQIVNAPRDVKDNPLQKIEMFVTYLGSNDSIPDAPQLVPFYLGANPSQSLQWYRVHDAMIYRVQLASDSLFTNLLLNQEVSQMDTAKTIASLMQPLSTYYWRVQANNGGHLSAFSATEQFSTGISGPNLVAPANNVNNIINTPLLEWNAAPGADMYRLQISKTPFFQQNQLVLDVDSIQTANYQITAGLPVNVRYYWRVQGVSNGTPGFFSQVWNFRPTVVTATAEQLSANETLEQNFPNPAHEMTSIRYSLTKPGPVQVTLTDVFGREVNVLTQTAYSEAGTYQLDIATGKLAAGVYLYQLQTGEQVVTRRMIIE